GMFKPEGYNASEALVPSSAAEGKWTTSVRPSSIAANDWPGSAPIGSSPVIVQKDTINKYIEGRANNIAKEEACAIYRPYLTAYPYNYPFRFTVEEIEQLNIIQTDLISYVFQTEAKWIAEGGIESDWDNYLKQLNNLGLEDYIKLYRTAFERTK
ncbi:MAG: hypothetical protein WCR70_08940, partial [Sphaerochaetaceae bacterium]